MLLDPVVLGDLRRRSRTNINHLTPLPVRRVRPQLHRGRCQLGHPARGAEEVPGGGATAGTARKGQPRCAGGGLTDTPGRPGQARHVSAGARPNLELGSPFHCDRAYAGNGPSGMEMIFVVHASSSGVWIKAGRESAGLFQDRCFGPTRRAEVRRDGPVTDDTDLVSPVNTVIGSWRGSRRRSRPLRRRWWLRPRPEGWR